MALYQPSGIKGMRHHDQPSLSFKWGVTENLKVMLEEECISAGFEYRACSWCLSWDGSGGEQDVVQDNCL